MDEKEKAASATNPQQLHCKDTDSNPLTQAETYEDMPDFASMADAADFNPIEAITDDEPSFLDVGRIRIKAANRSMIDASKERDPEDLSFGETLFFEGEACCLFAEQGAGKSCFASQMGNEIARTGRRVLYIDYELSEKQFQIRNTDKDTGSMRVFAKTFYRAYTNPEAARKNYRADNGKSVEDLRLEDIENAAKALDVSVVIIDNLTYLCGQAEKGDAAGRLMDRLSELKVKYGWSLLVLAHTRKIPPYQAISANDLYGSSKQMDLFDSAFVIGKSAKDTNLRYLKQTKVRVCEFKYTSEHVRVFELDKSGGYLRFVPRGFSTEREHLKTDFEETDAVADTVAELHRQGKSVREIASTLQISKSKVGRIVQSVATAQTAGGGCTGNNASTLVKDELF